MQKNQQLAHTYFLLALGLLSIFAYCILFSAISFIRGYSMSAWHFPAAGAMMLVTQYFAAHEFFPLYPKKIFFRSSGILVAIILLCIGFSSMVYDVSSDGQWYHQEIVYKIKNGWNPYVKELPVPKMAGVWDPVAAWCSGPHVVPKENINGDQEVVYVKYVSINHFSKGVETMQSAIYAVTNRIESGKAINIMMMLASLFLCLSVFYQWGIWTKGKKWLIAVTLTANSVVLVQLTSFCLDGIVYSVLICLMALFTLILRDRNKYYFFLFGLIVILLVNIKFTTVVYAAIFCMAFVIYLIVKKNWLILKKIVIAGSISFLIGFFFIGFHPYMTNLIKNGDVFEGLKETREENHAIMPGVMRDRSRFRNFFVSTGTHSVEMTAGENGPAGQLLKIPFSINKSEIKSANNPELNVAGFGPFFSGALIVSLILLTLIITRKGKERSVQTGLIALGVVLFSVFIMPDPWWARFVPQVWLIPCLILLISELFSVRSSFLRPVLYISLWLNITWAFLGILFNIFIASHINYQMDQIKAQKLPVHVEYCGYLDSRSNGYRFIEHDVPFIEQFVTGPHIYNVVHSTTRFESTEELPILPEPFLMGLGRKINGGKSD